MPANVEVGDRSLPSLRTDTRQLSESQLPEPFCIQVGDREYRLYVKDSPRGKLYVFMPAGNPIPEGLSPTSLPKRYEVLIDRGRPVLARI